MFGIIRISYLIVTLFYWSCCRKNVWGVIYLKGNWLFVVRFLWHGEQVIFLAGELCIVLPTRGRCTNNILFNVMITSVKIIILRDEYCWDARVSFLRTVITELQVWQVWMLTSYLWVSVITPFQITDWITKLWGSSLLFCRRESGSHYLVTIAHIGDTWDKATGVSLITSGLTPWIFYKNQRPTCNAFYKNTQNGGRNRCFLAEYESFHQRLNSFCNSTLEEWHIILQE